MTFPRSSELPWFGFGVLVISAVGVHLVGGFINWMAAPSPRSPASVSVAAAPTATASTSAPVPRATTVAPSLPAPAPVRAPAAVPSPMITAASGWLPQSVSVARLQGWLAFQQGGGRMPPELAQRLAVALQFAERVKRGYRLATHEESDLERRGAQVLRMNNDVTVRFRPEALPIPPNAR